MWKDDFSVGLSVSDTAVVVSQTSTFGNDGRRRWIFFVFCCSGDSRISNDLDTLACWLTLACASQQMCILAAHLVLVLMLSCALDWSVLWGFRREVGFRKISVWNAAAGVPPKVKKMRYVNWENSIRPHNKCALRHSHKHTVRSLVRVCVGMHVHVLARLLEHTILFLRGSLFHSYIHVIYPLLCSENTSKKKKTKKTKNHCVSDGALSPSAPRRLHHPAGHHGIGCCQ